MVELQNCEVIDFRIRRSGKEVGYIPMLLHNHVQCMHTNILIFRMWPLSGSGPCGVCTEGDWSDFPQL